ncbi:MAG: hypothetical protein EOO39_05825 [Cytophagaceae bacterium]|nr:MAG: hypothetical protein EOO39_05825 [Cytophagaceae bacterium]
MTWIVEIIKLGVPAALGVIIAALLIAWIGPDGWGGMALIFVLSIAVSYLLVWSGSQMLSLFRKKPVPGGERESWESSSVMTTGMQFELWILFSVLNDQVSSSQ